MKRIALSLLTFLAFCCQITAQDNTPVLRSALLYHKKSG